MRQGFRLEKWFRIQEGEWRLTILSFAYFFFLLSSYYILRPVRDEMGIRGGISNLPWLFTGTFAAILSAVPLYAAIASRFPPRKFVPLVYRFFNVHLLLFWMLFLWGENTRWAARAFFIWTSVFNLFVVSVFWSFMVDVFNKDQAKRIFGFIAAGGTLGALAGPLLTIGLVRLIGTTHMILISCMLLEIAVFFIRRIIPRADQIKEQAAPIGGTLLSGIGIIFRSPYLIFISLYIFLMTTGSTFIYLTQAEIISRALKSPDERTLIFAVMDLGVNMLTLFIQTFLTARIISRFGMVFSLGLLPAWTAAGLAVLSYQPHLIAIMAIQIVARSLRYSVTHPAREILFTVVSREEKYKSKNFIDTVVYRGGDAASAWLFQSMRGILMLPQLLLFGVSAALLWLALGVRLGRKHPFVKKENPVE